ncbi:methyltransferase domain-containing protein [Candidatus Collierbacteria bacterium]|nr:methyltransferase domain-containing protein [Candidatus Collierbacteria bacterium]
MIKTKQLNVWTGKFGEEYTDRNIQTIESLDRDYRKEFGVSATTFFRDALHGLPISSVLEIGCNIGNKLAIFHSLGIKNLTGVEPQQYAIKKGKKRYPFIAFRQGTVFDLPYPSNSFDLVFTSDVLIHVSPKHLAKALGEIVRVSRHFVLGFEFYSGKSQAVVYRSHSDFLWRRDYKQDYLKLFPNVTVIYERKFNHNEKVVGAAGLKSEIFVLKKN